MTEIIRKPKVLYPLPDNLDDLDWPHPEIIENRHFRVNPFIAGYDVNSGDDPTRAPRAESPSNILSKLR